MCVLLNVKRGVLTIVGAIALSKVPLLLLFLKQCGLP